MSLFIHVPSIILTIGVERLPKRVPLGHGDGQDEVLEAGDTEEDRVLIVGQVLGSHHCAVQWHVPGAGRGEGRGSDEARGALNADLLLSMSTWVPIPDEPGPSPALRDGDVVAEDLHGDEQSGLEEQAAQHEDADQRPLGTLHSQLLGRTSATHQHCHSGGDDQVEEEELEIAQVGVDLGGRKHPLSVWGQASNHPARMR